MREDVAQSIDHTSGIPDSLKTSALKQLRSANPHAGEAIFNEACRLLLLAYANRNRGRRTPAGLDTDELLDFASAFTIWGISKKTATDLVHALEANPKG